MANNRSIHDMWQNNKIIGESTWWLACRLPWHCHLCHSQHSSMQVSWTWIFTRSGWWPGGPSRVCTLWSTPISDWSLCMPSLSCASRIIIGILLKSSSYSLLFRLYIIKHMLSHIVLSDNISEHLNILLFAYLR